MFASFAGAQPAALALARIPNADVNCRSDLHHSTHLNAPQPSSSCTKTPSITEPKRFASTQTPHPPRPNPHSTLHRRRSPPHRGFLPWRFSDAGRRCTRHRPQAAGIRKPSQKQTNAPQQETALFYHLVGKRQQSRRNFEPKNFRGLNIHHEV